MSEVVTGETAAWKTTLVGALISPPLAWVSVLVAELDGGIVLYLILIALAAAATRSLKGASTLFLGALASLMISVAWFLKNFNI